MNDANQVEIVKDSALNKPCQHCGSVNCMCKAGSCPMGKADRVLCMILKLVKIIVFIMLAYVLFDIHTVIKLSERNAEAASAGMPPAGMMIQQGAGQPTT